MDPMTNQREFDTIERDNEKVRESLKQQEIQVRCLMDHPRFKSDEAFNGQHGEMRANLMLAVRHIEDARMRLGKVIQFAGDGVSVYDRAQNDPRTRPC